MTEVIPDYLERIVALVLSNYPKLLPKIEFAVGWCGFNRALKACSEVGWWGEM
ncbi:hypothetical protein PEDI_46200 [Persicobacter diffluens]|uniref:Uncharacterized protein n=1 Tax=Persicobacter diffluens TaxID=981 RepID=A0AAN4W3P5_9BACT|nr:hypothetical protein PEDI_46200 [Persicobacter diffluens]